MLQDTTYQSGYKHDSRGSSNEQKHYKHIHTTRAHSFTYTHFTTITTLYTQRSATPCATAFLLLSFISQIIPSEESWKAPWGAGCPSAGFGPLIFRFPLLCFYVYRRRWVCTGHHMAGSLVYATNVDYPIPCTLYVFFLFAFELHCFRVLYPYTPCQNKMAVIFCSLATLASCIAPALSFTLASLNC